MPSDPRSSDAEWQARLTKAGQKLADARKKEKAAREEARNLAVNAHHDGQTEAGIARMLGVDRMAVREWLGKRETSKKEPPKPGDEPSAG